MLNPRTTNILKYIVSQYIEGAVPVSSQTISRGRGISVSSATVRNEMALLEEQGYILRPHTSAGSVPSDKGYRFYVDSLPDLGLPLDRQRLLSHVFHQVEREIDEWLKLAASLLAQMSRNVAVVAVPKQSDCRFKHVEMVSLQEKLALVVLVLIGARVKQKLVSFETPVSQASLAEAANHLNDIYTGLSVKDIPEHAGELSLLEKQITDILVQIMQSDDEQQYDAPYLDGLHLVLNQPEFAHGDQVKNLIKLIETRTLLKMIMPEDFKGNAVHVIIGNENKALSIRNCSVIISHYGIPGATGTIGVVGPTRMAYSDAIPSVYYLSNILTEMVAGLYGKQSGANTN